MILLPLNQLSLLVRFLFVLFYCNKLPDKQPQTKRRTLAHNFRELPSIIMGKAWPLHGGRTHSRCTVAVRMHCGCTADAQQIHEQMHRGCIHSRNTAAAWVHCDCVDAGRLRGCTATPQRVDRECTADALRWTAHVQRMHGGCIVDAQ